MQPIERFTSGVRFVSGHHCGPLLLAHGTSSGIGEKIDKDLLAFQVKHVVMGLFDPFIAFPGRTGIHGFDHLDLIWFCVW